MVTSLSMPAWDDFSLAVTENILRNNDEMKVRQHLVEDGRKRKVADYHNDHDKDDREVDDCRLFQHLYYSQEQHFVKACYDHLQPSFITSKLSATPPRSSSFTC